MTGVVPDRPGHSRRIVAERLLGCALGGLLLYSAAAHLLNPWLFLSTIYSYEIVTVSVGVWVAILVPPLQCVVGMALIAGWWRHAAYWVALPLFLSFAGVQASAYFRELDISCGCFGASASLKIGPATLALVGSCALASLIGLLLTLAPKGSSCDAHALPSA